MLTDAHCTFADDIEAAISMLSGSQRALRLLIEGDWGAAQPSTGLRLAVRPNMANIRKVIPVWGCKARCKMLF
jgi:hypothetical protein